MEKQLFGVKNLYGYFKKSLLKAKPSHEEAISLVGNVVTISLTDSKEDLILRDSLIKSFTLGGTSSISEEEKEVYYNEGITKDTFVATNKKNNTFYITEGTLKIVVSKKEVVDNERFVLDLMSGCDFSIFNTLKYVNVTESTLQNVRNSRLKTLNVSELLERLTKMFYENATAHLEYPEISNQKDLLRISLWNSLNVNNMKEKKELDFYLLYNVLNYIETGMPVDDSIDKAINIKTNELEHFAHFYGEIQDVVDVSKQYVNRFNLDFNIDYLLENNLDIELDSGDYIEQKQAIFRFVSIVKDELGILLPEKMAETLIKSRLRNLNTFNKEFLPMVTENILKAKTKAANDLLVKHNLENDDFIIVLNELGKGNIHSSVGNKKFSKYFKDIVLKGELDINLIDRYIVENIVFGDTEANKYNVGGKLHVDSLLEDTSNFSTLENNLPLIVNTIDYGYANKLIVKTDVNRIEKNIKTTMNRETLNAIKERDIDKVKRIYEMIYKGVN